LGVWGKRGDARRPNQKTPIRCRDERGGSQKNEIREGGRGKKGAVGKWGGDQRRKESDVSIRRATITVLNTWQGSKEPKGARKRELFARETYPHRMERDPRASQSKIGEGETTTHGARRITYREEKGKRRRRSKAILMNLSQKIFLRRGTNSAKKIRRGV